MNKKLQIDSLNHLLNKGATVELLDERDRVLKKINRIRQETRAEIALKQIVLLESKLLEDPHNEEYKLALKNIINESLERMEGAGIVCDDVLKDLENNI